MFETLENIDRMLFLKINGWHNELLDSLIPVLTNFPTWIPLFAIAIYFMYKKHRRRVGLILLAIALMIVCTDQGANAFKNGVKRYRPTHNTKLEQHVHTVNGYKGGQYGFVSGHAANSFAIAFFLMMLFRDTRWWAKALFIAWALLVCYTRIYLGVHYPSDIAGGAILGSLMAFIFYRLYVWANKQLDLKQANS